MKIEAVITCVDYADFLAETLPINLHNFENVVVVTSPRDTETVELCRRLGVICRPTELFYADQDRFAKARGIDYGMAFLRQDEWILHLDADMIIPQMSRRWLEMLRLDPDCIYGIDRMLCPNWNAWQKFKTDIAGKHQHDYHCRVNVPDFPMGDRIAIREYGGYCPIGYFQLWHGRHRRGYPLLQGTAERTDVQHAMQWEARNRRLIPELVGIHLESERSFLGANWSGRTTRRFGPQCERGEATCPSGQR
jgi:hypothetical protein